MKKNLSASLLALVLAAFAAGQTPTPTPALAPVPTPTPSLEKLQSLTELQSRIYARLARPELRRGQVGVKIVSMNTGKVIFDQNSEKYFMPASNMKNFTVAAALEKLTPDYKFVTSVFAPSMPDSNGVVRSLRIYGRGDVSISTAFFPLDDSDKDPVTGKVDETKVYYKGIDRLVEKIAAAGVKRIEGELVADETFFTGNPVPGSWEWDDLQWYYGAEISALPLNDNAIDLSVKPGTAGQACIVKLSPYNAVVRITNLCTTTAAGTPRTLRIEKKIDRNILEISGTLPVGNAGFNRPVTVSRPAELFIALLKERLALKGITVAGATRVVNNKVNLPADATIEIAKLESLPLSLIAAKTMKPSQNMYTETLLWTVGENARVASLNSPGGGVAPSSTSDSAELGIAAVKKFLTDIGVAPDGIIQHDGSGLSRHNLITPAAVVQLYTYMGKQSRFSQAWRDSLTIGGVDGTLRNRFSGTRAAGNVRGKTGTIDQVSALSGYVRTAAGEELVFSMVVNGIIESSVRTAAMDEIVVALANFDGRID
ncbi:MAG TPA: D-alanyl-D-alanine carboxypeptidase/D-alanyl-D-alanine-endopeptidase [Pyrinomonadaceae bacterium]|nr:D-alanyl-D-alanine carboxypeptidase/D-alanyl-D-alanine-endopeptidase [Pyrinomonadaceae bacterium]